MDYRNGCRDDLGAVPDIHIYRCDMSATRDGTVFRTHIAWLVGWNGDINCVCAVAKG